MSLSNSLVSLDCATTRVIISVFVLLGFFELRSNVRFHCLIVNKGVANVDELLEFQLVLSALLAKLALQMFYGQLRLSCKFLLFRQLGL